MISCKIEWCLDNFNRHIKPKVGCHHGEPVRVFHHDKAA